MWPAEATRRPATGRARWGPAREGSQRHPEDRLRSPGEGMACRRCPPGPRNFQSRRLGRGTPRAWGKVGGARAAASSGHPWAPRPQRGRSARAPPAPGCRPGPGSPAAAPRRALTLGGRPSAQQGQQQQQQRDRRPSRHGAPATAQRRSPEWRARAGRRDGCPGGGAGRAAGAGTGGRRGDKGGTGRGGVAFAPPAAPRSGPGCGARVSGGTGPGATRTWEKSLPHPTPAPGKCGAVPSSLPAGTSRQKKMSSLLRKSEGASPQYARPPPCHQDPLPRRGLSLGGRVKTTAYPGKCGAPRLHTPYRPNGTPSQQERVLEHSEIGSLLWKVGGATSPRTPPRALP